MNAEAGGGEEGRQQRGDWRLSAPQREREREAEEGGGGVEAESQGHRARVCESDALCLMCASQENE